MPRILFVCYFFLLFAAPASGQQDSLEVRYDDALLVSKQITDEDLLTYRDDPSYDYEVVKAQRTWWDDFKDWLGNQLLRFFEWLFGGENAVGYLAAFLRIIPYILLAILIFILIKFFLNVNANALRQSKKDGAYVTLSEEEHLIKNEDIQELIRKALTDKNYRLAIRYYYLYTLQVMTDKNLIDWQLQKTNDDYLKELKRTELKEPFRTITRLYDYIWYGNFDMDEAKYIKAEHAFIQLQKTLTNA